jgi:hypothetical protein
MECVLARRQSGVKKWLLSVLWVPLWRSSARCHFMGSAVSVRQCPAWIPAMVVAIMVWTSEGRCFGAYPW